MTKSVQNKKCFHIESGRKYFDIISLRGLYAMNWRVKCLIPEM